MDESERYESAATQLLKDIGAHLGLVRVEGKQKLKSQRSGRMIEVDGVGYRDDGSFLLVEDKLRSKRRLWAGELEVIAYRILDTDAAGGVIVTTLGLQKGAKLVAKAENIIEVTLDESATDEKYIARLANQHFAKMGDQVCLADSVRMELLDSDGNVIQTAGNSGDIVPISSQFRGHHT